MPHHFSRYASIFVVALVAALAGCRSNIRRAEPVEFTLPATEQRALDISSRDRARYEHAVELAKAHQLPEAQSNFQQLLEEAPELPGVHLNLALIHFQKQEFDLARPRVDEALRLSPRNAVAHNLDGSLRRREGRFKEAQTAYVKALAIDPDYAAVHFNLAVLYDIYLQYWIDAREHYLRYQELSGSRDEQLESWIDDLDLRIRQAGG